jgi:hypothetical protein
MVLAQKQLDRALNHLQSLPFIRGLHFRQKENDADQGHDGTLELKTPHGQYLLSVEIKRSYLSESLVNAILSRASGQAQSGRQSKRHTKSDELSPRLLLARYIPTRAGERFIEAGISFADDPGNVHLRLGSEYNWTVLGKREPPRLAETNRTTAATIQLLFQFAVDPKSASWTVRDLAGAAGISKTKVAQLRRQFIHERILSGKSELRMTPDIVDRLVSGYSQILRPKLVISRFRYPDSSIDEFLARLTETVRAKEIPYALTGGPAADAMQHFYSSPDVPLFLDLGGSDVQRTLRLLPDRGGPVVLLRPFGAMVYWKEFEGRMVAPPWLVYAELLTSDDPRAREAAEELRRGFLR